MTGTLLSLNDLVRDSVISIEPRDHFACTGVIGSFVALAKGLFFFAKPVETDVLEREQVFSQQPSDMFSKNLDARAAE